METYKMPTIRYRDFFRGLQAKMQTKRNPMRGQWEITFGCNLKCAHCYVVEDSHKQELTFREIAGILDQIHREGCLWLCLTGGEPLLRTDFLDIYTYAARKGFLITLFTNGTLITSEIADHLKEYPPFMIEITLNAITTRTYERITGVAGSFRQAMRGIHIILERGLPLTIKSVGMSINRDEILGIKEYVDSLKNVMYRYDSIILPRLDGSKQPCQFRLSAEEITDIEQSDNDIYREWRQYVQPNPRHLKADSLFRCGAGISSFNISPYGELQLCHILRRPSFDLRRGSFRQGFYHLFPKVRSATYRSHSECKDCPIWYLCPQCPGRAQLENGDPEIPVDYFCKLAHRRQEARQTLVEDGLS